MTHPHGLADQVIRKERRKREWRAVIVEVVEVRFGKRHLKWLAKKLESIKNFAILRAILKLTARSDNFNDIIRAVTVRRKKTIASKNSGGI